MFKFKKLHSKFTFGAAIVLAFVAIAIVLITLSIVTRMSGQLTRGYTEMALVSTGYTARNIDNHLIEMRAGVDAMYHILPVLPNDDARFASIDSFFGTWGMSYIGFSDGRYHISSDWVPPYWWVPYERPWYLLAMANSGSAAFIPPYVDAMSGNLVITIARHVGRIDGVDAVFAIDIPITNMLALVWDAVTIPGSYAFLVDQNGRIIVHTHDTNIAPDIVNNAIVATYVHEVSHYRQFLDAYQRGYDILRVTDYSGEDWHLTAHSIYEAGWTLYLAVPDSFFYTGAVATLIRVSVGSTLVGLVILAILRLAINRVVTRPINKLVDLMSDVTQGKLGINIDTSNLSQDEIGVLTQDVYSHVGVIKGMVDDLNTMYKEYMQIGNIQYKVDSTKYQNSFGEMMEMVNKLISQVVTDIVSVADVMSSISDGDFDTQMDESVWMGEWVFMPKALNDLVSNIRTVSAEVNAMIESVANKGDLSFQIDESNYKGDWRGIMIGLNSIATAVEKPIKVLDIAMSELKVGNFDVVVIDKKITASGLAADAQSYSGIFRDVIHSFEESIVHISSYIDELEQVLSQMAGGELRNSITREYVGSFDLIKRSVNNINNRLNVAMSEISMAAKNVHEGATRITSSSIELSDGSTAQAASLEELNTSVDMIKEQTQEFAENAREANRLSGKSTVDAQEGNNAMKQMVDAMSQIKGSSDNISKIIKVIQDIAFQTNLLALNASVEAARAGEHGKGFAVVADEVRSLAGRSQTAAAETTALIQESITSVESGSSTAQTTAQSLEAIVSGATDVLALINNITNAANEQAEMITQISSVLLHTANTVQDNSKFAHESAATAEELASQADMLQQLVSYFKI